MTVALKQVTQVFQVVTLCCWGSGSPHFQGTLCFHCVGQVVQHCLTFEALGTAHQLTWHHISKNLNPQQYHQFENFKFRRFLHLRYWYMFIKLHGVIFQKELLIIQHIHNRCSIMHQVELWVSSCQIIISMISCRKTKNISSGMLNFVLGRLWKWRHCNPSCQELFPKHNTVTSKKILILCKTATRTQSFASYNKCESYTLHIIFLLKNVYVSLYHK